jgi:ribosomal protein S18 acetylase RimI-like enzyme
MSMAANQLAVNGRTSGMHPGDVAHRIGSGLRAYSTDDVVLVWTDNGSVAAFALLWPEWDAFDLGAAVSLEPSAFASIVEEAARLAARDGRVETETYPGDKRLIGAVQDLGFVKVSDPFTITSQDLRAPRPSVVDGYVVRSARLDESDEICDAHVSAFSSSWTHEQYRAYMQTPPYDPEFEVVAVADDVVVAGFAVVWLDHVNSVGYFEPVGTHADHQRRGVGSAILSGGMNLMLANGMTRAVVMHDTDAEQNARFYRSCGFRPIGTIGRWVRESNQDQDEGQT